MTSSDARAIVFIALTENDRYSWDSFLEQVRWVVTFKVQQNFYTNPKLFIVEVMKHE